MTSLEVFYKLAITLFFLIVLPSSIAMFPSISAYIKIKKRTPKNLTRAKRIILLSFIFLLASYIFLIYKFIYGLDETGTPGFVLAITGYIFILLPIVITAPLANKAYILSIIESQ